MGLAMALAVSQSYEFDGFRIDVARRQLRNRAGEIVELPARAFDTLLYLVEHRGEDLSKNRLIKAVWPHAVVEENNLNQAISALRRALGDTRAEPRYVMTVPGRGYRFIATVRTEPIEQTSSPSPAEVPAARQRRLTSRMGWLLGSAGLALALALGALLVWTNDWVNGGAGPALNSVAVLPFKPVVQQQNDPALELGMADTLIAQISTLHGVTVRPLSAVRRYASPEHDPIQAGVELRVAAVLDGTIQKRDQRIRVTSRLLRVSDGRSLWTGQFDEPVGDIFGIQDSISARVMEALARALGTELPRTALRRPTESLEAFHIYAAGLYNLNPRNYDGMAKAVQDFEAALRADADYVRAWSALANALVVQGVFGMRPPQAVFPRAKDAALKAIELDPRSAEAHHALGHVLTQYERRYIEADEHYRTSINLNGNDATAYMRMGINHAHLGQLEDALAEMSHARDLEPTTMVFSTNLGMLEYYARDYDEAIVELRRVIELQPDSDHAHRILGRALLQQGDIAGALEHFNSRSYPSPGSFGDLGRAYAAARRLPEARAEIEKLDQLGRQGFGVSYDVATIYALLNELGPACDALRRALEDYSQMLGYLRVDPAIDGLRGEPCYADVFRRLYPWERASSQVIGVRISPAASILFRSVPLI
jgi:DNA-binding winged helix-turn-helix (wHTH) protein/TolB-like protein/Flp pilus assembly protein TadD